MKTVLLYNLFLLFVIAVLIAAIIKVQKSDILDKHKRILKIVGIVLIVCAAGAILFIDGILFGIIGPVPN